MIDVRIGIIQGRQTTHLQDRGGDETNDMGRAGKGTVSGRRKRTDELKVGCLESIPYQAHEEIIDR